MNKVAKLTDLAGQGKEFTAEKLTSDSCKSGVSFSNLCQISSAVCKNGFKNRLVRNSFTFADLSPDLAPVKRLHKGETG